MFVAVVLEILKLAQPQLSGLEFELETREYSFKPETGNIWLMVTNGMLSNMIRLMAVQFITLYTYKNNTI